MADNAPYATSREQAEAKRRDQILAFPQWTLLRLGWEIEPGRVQGGIFYRIADGLGPTGRDRTARAVLRDEVARSHMPHAAQRWGIEVLATPESGGNNGGIPSPIQAPPGQRVRTTRDYRNPI